MQNQRVLWLALAVSVCVAYADVCRLMSQLRYEQTRLAALTTPDLTKIRRAYVALRVGSGIGTGVAIRHGGELFILTVAHVVSHAGQITAETYDHHTTICDLIRKDVMDDLALLKPRDSFGLTPATVASKRPTLGDPCWYMSSGDAIHASLEKSIINRSTAVELFVNGNAWFGSSGAGIFAIEAGELRLVGIHSALVKNSPRTPLRAVPLSAIERFLQ